MKTAVSHYLIALVKIIFVFFAPVKGIIFLVALSTVLDTGFGFWKAKHQKQSITSKKWRHGFVPKVLSYIVAVMLVYTSDYFILNELVRLALDIEFLSTKLIALALISIEVKSMDESFVKVKGWSFLQKITSYILKAKNIKKEINE